MNKYILLTMLVGALGSITLVNGCCGVGDSCCCCCATSAVEPCDEPVCEAAHDDEANTADQGDLDIEPVEAAQDVLK